MSDRRIIASVTLSSVSDQADPSFSAGGSNLLCRYKCKLFVAVFENRLYMSVPCGNTTRLACNTVDLDRVDLGLRLPITRNRPTDVEMIRNA